jgi:hypothetical protein
MAKKLWVYDLDNNLVQGEVFMEYTTTILRPTRKKWIDKKNKIWEWDDKGDSHVLLRGKDDKLIRYDDYNYARNTFKTKKEAIASKKPLALVELW